MMKIALIDIAAFLMAICTGIYITIVLIGVALYASTLIASLATIQLTALILFAIVNHIQRLKLREMYAGLLKYDREVLAKVTRIEEAYKSYLETHDLTSLVYTLQKEVGKPHTAEETGG